MTWTETPVGDVPLVELDRLLEPVRRVLSWAVADRARTVRYAEANLGRFLRRAAALDVSEDARGALSAMLARLEGFDGAPDPRERLAALYAELARLDAVLGLPLGRRVAKPAPGRAAAVEPADPISFDEPSADDDTDEVLVAADEPDRRVRFGDPGASGRPIAAFGLSPAHVAALAEEGVETLADLLLVPPSDEEVLRPVHGAGRDLPVGRVAVGGRVRRRITRLRADGAVTDVLVVGAGPLTARFAGVPAPWLLERLALGERTVLVGTWDGSQLVEPEPAVAREHEVVLARYGFEGVPDELVRGILVRALPDIERIRDVLPREVVQRVGMSSFADALVGAHLGGLPTPSRRRLAFDEALLVQLGLAAPRFAAGRERGLAHPIQHALVARLMGALEVTLDDARQAAFEDIKRDLRASQPMLRLLTGEAGAGKGLLGLLAAVIVAEAKAQVLVVAPDALSAEMAALFGEALLREIGLVGRIVVGDPSRSLRDAIRRGEVHVVFATPDVFDRELEFRRLGLVIAHEGQDAHGYGRAAVRVAALRTPRPDVLVLASTPVPSAVLLSAYGDHDLSVVDTVKLPKAELFAESEREAAWRVVARAVASGGQAVVVLPTVPGASGEPVEVVDLREARRIAEAIEAETIGPRAPEASPRVGVLHGSLSREDRLRVYEDLQHRRIDVLVSTMPVEDGPPVPGVEVVLVERAEQASTWRLQRLRGYLGSCLQAGAAAADAARWGAARLACVVGDGDAARRAAVEAFVAAPEATGWDHAETLLRDRGLEAMLAREVPPAARLRWLDPGEDRELLLRAREEAHRILEEDPGLRRPAWQDLARLLRERWDDLVGLPTAGEPERALAAKKRRRRRKRR